MALQSMTGFGRSEGTAGRQRWAWELRSVNGKGLDLRIRLPNGYERLEAEVRTLAAGTFKRGNLQISLSASTENTAQVPVVNEEALAVVLAALDGLKGRVDAAPPTLDGLLNIRGVLELREPAQDEGERAAADDAILAGLADALDQLADTRTAEGAAIREMLAGQLSRIEELARAIDADPSRSLDVLRERLREQVAMLVADAGLDPQRLHAEAAILAAKADLREEIDRLGAHVAAGRDLLRNGGPVGRRLDFLAQEFNREANTICSKSNAAAVTAHGMELKVVIDQLREQVQNLE